MSTRTPDGELWVRDFTPGFLDSPENDTLPNGATPDAKNAYLYNMQVDGIRRAVMGRRPGSRLINSTALSSEARVDGLFEWRRGASSALLLAMCAGALSSVNPVTLSASAIGSGWTTGRTARLVSFRNDAFIFDGAYQRRYDGTTLYEVGSAAPGTISNMTAGAGTVIGTYESGYTWYNQNRDRHSSISAITATLVLAGQGRTHTIPGSAAPTWATHWGIWVRRTDTSELSRFFTAIVPVGTASYTEAISDTVRQRGIVAPLPGTHDAPPGAWAILAEYKGYGIGILDGSDSYYASADGDLESWSASHKFPVSRATGDFLSFGIPFGEEFLIGTGHATWRLEGDQVPFRIRPVHPRYGCVSQDAGLEVDGRFYGWDRVHGPYVTDLVEWRKLGLHRIDTILAQVNKTEVSDIRCVHAEGRGLIGWSVPLAGSARRRTILWYSYVTDSWLPPQTGMEYASLCTFTANGALGVYMGDYWGRVYELFSGTKDGVPATSPTDNVRVANVLSATAGTVTADVGAGALYTTGSGLAGMPVAVVNAAGTVWQWRIIKSNTSSVITLDTVNGTPWTQTPDSTWRVVVGGIEWYWWTLWVDYGVPHLEKVLDHLWIQAKTTSAEHDLEVSMRFNNDDRTVEQASFTFSVSSAAGIFDVSLWDQANWAEVRRQLRKKKIVRAPFTCQIRFRNYFPDQDIKITMWGLTADVRVGRKAPSVQP